MISPIQRALDIAIATGKELQIKLKHDFSISQGGMSAPLGPGKVERIELHGTLDVAGPTGVIGCVYKLYVPAMLPPTKPSERPKQMILPITFAADDVLWFSEGPLNEEGSPIVTVTGGKTPGGLHIPGGS